MIPSQQAMMLKSAMAFEHLVKFSRPSQSGDEKKSRAQDYKGGITWSQAKEVPAFISQLQAAARHLMEENRQLRKVHFELIAKVVLFYLHVFYYPKPKPQINKQTRLPLEKEVTSHLFRSECYLLY